MSELLFNCSNSIGFVNSISTTEHALPPSYMVVPFVLLLLMIAVGPLLFYHFWEKNYPIIAGVLGAITVSYYLFFLL